MTMKTLISAALVSAAALTWSMSAEASKIEMNYNDFANGSKTGSISGVRNVSVRAGLFDFKVNDNETGEAYWDEDLQAFCIDVSTNLVTSGKVSYTLEGAGSSDFLTDRQRSLIAQLFDLHGDKLGNAEADAAFQLALWEIMYDSGGSLTLTNGNFRAGTFDSARNLAQGWLNDLNGVDDYSSSQFEFFVLRPYSPTSNQTLLTWRPVPEPALLALLGGGLLLIAVARRRRQPAVSLSIQ
ncbi:MAG: PEP-CTERM sorting domain-containing protein [Gammaproteobacteria bacterium]|nr:MAG: PEP-CTERM sorting domain-containing protein [Gammaproteobacteria bacterium]